MALAAGFGIDLERCDPWIVEAMIERLDEQERRRRQDEAMERLKAKAG